MELPESDGVSLALHGRRKTTIPIRLKSSNAPKTTRSKTRARTKTKKPVEAEVVKPLENDILDDDIENVNIPTLSRNAEEPLHKNKKLKWDHKVNFLGEKRMGDFPHCCDICKLPIFIYGRLNPCRHVYCYSCAKRLDKKCTRCGKTATEVDMAQLEKVFICSYGTPRHSADGCRRSYLSERDLKSHIAFRHKKSKNSAPNNDASHGLPTSNIVTMSQGGHVNINVMSSTHVLQSVVSSTQVHGQILNPQMPLANRSPIAVQVPRQPVVGLTSPTNIPSGTRVLQLQPQHGTQIVATGNLIQQPHQQPIIQPTVPAANQSQQQQMTPMVNIPPPSAMNRPPPMMQTMQQQAPAMSIQSMQVQNNPGLITQATVQPAVAQMQNLNIQGHQDMRTNALTQGQTHAMLPNNNVARANRQMVGQLQQVSQGTTLQQPNTGTSIESYRSSTSTPQQVLARNLISVPMQEEHQAVTSFPQQRIASDTPGYMQQQSPAVVTQQLQQPPHYQMTYQTTVAQSHPQQQPPTLQQQAQQQPQPVMQQQQPQQQQQQQQPPQPMMYAGAGGNPPPLQFGTVGMRTMGPEQANQMMRAPPTAQSNPFSGGNSNGPPPPQFSGPNPRGQRPPVWSHSQRGALRGGPRGPPPSMRPPRGQRPPYFK